MKPNLSEHKRRLPKALLFHSYTCYISHIFHKFDNHIAMLRTIPRAALQTVCTLVCMQQGHISEWSISFYGSCLSRGNFCLPMGL